MRQLRLAACLARAEADAQPELIEASGGAGRRRRRRRWRVEGGQRAAGRAAGGGEDAGSGGARGVALAASGRRASGRGWRRRGWRRAAAGVEHLHRRGAGAADGTQLAEAADTLIDLRTADREARPKPDAVAKLIRAARRALGRLSSTSRDPPRGRGDGIKLGQPPPGRLAVQLAVGFAVVPERAALRRLLGEARLLARTEADAVGELVVAGAGALDALLCSRRCGRRRGGRRRPSPCSSECATEFTTCVQAAMAAVSMHPGSQKLASTPRAPASSDLQLS